MLEYFWNYDLILIIIQICIIIGIYYLLLLITKYNNDNFINIDNYYLYSLIIINILLLFIKFYIAIINYNFYKKTINNIYNIINKIYISCLISHSNNENNNDFEDDIVDTNYQNSQILENRNIFIENSEFDNDSINYSIDDNSYQSNNHSSNNSNYPIIPRSSYISYTSNNSVNYNNNDIYYLLEIFLLYITYIFDICKYKHNNFINLNTKKKFKDYSKYELFIDDEIFKLYVNPDINNYQFKLNYLEQLIEKELYKYNIINSYSNIFINYRKLQYNVFNLIHHINNIIFYKILKYSNNFLLIINTINILIYYINNNNTIKNNNLNLDIIYIILLLFVLYYLNNISNNLNNIFKYYLNLDTILLNIYNELIILYNFNKNKIIYKI